MSSLSSTNFVVLIWGLVASTLSLVHYQGIMVDRFTATRPRFIAQVKLRSTQTDLGTMFGLLAVGRGIGAIASKLLSF